MTRRAARLALFAPNLSGGGAERVLARLATHWSEQGRDVTLVTLAAVSQEDFPVPPRVHRVGLELTADSGGLVGALRNNLRRIRAAREAFRAAKPDVVVCFIEQANVLALLAAYPLGIPVVISERTDPSRHRISRLWDFLRRRTYPRCTALVVLTDEIAERMRYIVRGRPVIVIPNGVAAPCSIPSAGAGHAMPTVLGVGRLGHEKGFDRLINAFIDVDGPPGSPPWRLVILGDGPRRTELSIAAGRSRRPVELPGRVADPSSWYAQADLFALPSRYEGFPNALLEAMAHGLPVVAFDGPPAVRKTVRHGIDGLLVPEGDMRAFAAALRELMTDADRRRRMGEAAREVVTRFGLDAFFARWDSVIDAAASGNFSQVSRGGGE